MAQNTFTRRVMVRGEEKTVTLKVKDLDEPKRLKREAREKAREKARAEARAEARARSGAVDPVRRATRSEGENAAS